jgi:hypothetical protein
MGDGEETSSGIIDRQEDENMKTRWWIGLIMYVDQE